MKSITLLMWIVLVLAFSCKSQNIGGSKTARKHTGSLNMKLENGHWFDGQTFSKKTAWVNDITTFPNRKIGYLQEGYEASFLVLDRNPLVDISDINDAIILKVKQGIILNP